MKKNVFAALSLLLTLAATAQGVKIGDTQSNPDGSAGLEVSFSDKGFLPPRLTTTERNTIQNPANGLQIFNTTTRCYEGYDAVSEAWSSFGCLCPVPTIIQASASADSVCEGDMVYLSGLAIGATSWYWTGPNGFTATDQNPTVASFSALTSGTYTLIATNTCGQSTPAATTINLISAPTTADAGIDQNITCGVSTAGLTGNTPTFGVGLWTVVSGTATITDPSSPTSGVTGLVVPGTAVLRWTISNGCISSYDEVTLTTTAFICGVCTIMDIDYFTYNTVLIGNQCWMRENLKTGALIPVTTVQTDNGIIEKHCSNLNGQEDSSCPLGGLYTWYEMMGYTASCNGSGTPPNDKCPNPVQGICPTGWHIPSHYEWTTLEKNVGSSPNSFPYNTVTTNWLGTNEGGNLKATHSWNTPNAGATNNSNFTALPGGFSYGGLFKDVGNYGYWWSSTEYNSTSAWDRFLNISYAQSHRGYDIKEDGFTVRCVRN